jgi:hypothetical protein
MTTIMAEAESHVGYHEGPNNDNQFGRHYGTNHQPWCAFFVMYCAEHAGRRVDNTPAGDYPHTGYCPDALHYYGEHGRLHTNPEPGDQVLYVHRASGVAYHTGIVTAVSGNQFTTVEGNTSPDHGVDPDGGGVYRRHHTLTELHRNGIVAKFGRPHPAVAPHGAHPTTDQHGTPHPHPDHDLHPGHQERTLRITIWDSRGDYDYLYRGGDDETFVPRAKSSTGHHHWTATETSTILQHLKPRNIHGHVWHDHERAFVEKADGTHWPLDTKLVDALDEVGRDLRRKIRIISGHRTLAEQRRLYNLYKQGRGNLAAYPNRNAPHIRGIAADCGVIDHLGHYTSIANYAGAPNALHHHGLNATVHSEAWHVSRQCYGPWAYTGHHPT